MSSVAIVTDSTACLTPDLISGSGVAVVPIQVLLDSKTYYDGVDISSHEIAEALMSSQHVTTSKPTPHQFLEAYQRAAQQGAQAIISVHLSAALSGTYDSARLAARDAPVPVTVVDSHSIGMGLGFAALSASAAVADGRTVDEAATLAQSNARKSYVLFYVDTLEYLRRGGRIGKASAWLGGALRIKPLLHVVNGEVAPLEKARTSAKALNRLSDLAIEAARGRKVRVAVQHLDAPERAELVAAKLQRELDIPVVLCEVSAVMGVHVGPGAVSVVVAPGAGT